MPEGRPAIRLEDVRRRFGNGLPALDGVSFDIARGEIFGIVGRSGAGKSTLVRLLNGLERADSGRVLVDGFNVGDLSGERLRQLRRRVQMIFQGFGLLSSRTVAQNVALPLEIVGEDRGAIRSRVSHLLERVGLSDYRDKFPAQLSGGQKQRVGIARALATQPAILLCDEATSALDPQTTASILSLIEELNRELGLTIVVITHEVDVVRRLCDRVAVLHAGRVAEYGCVADIVLSPRSPEARTLLAEAIGGGERDRIAFAGPVIDLILRGDNAHQPVLSRVSRETGVDFVILSGRVGQLRDGRFGRFTLGLTGGDQARARAMLAQAGKLS